MSGNLVKGQLNFAGNETIKPNSAQGRWPANLILDEQAAKLLDEQSGDRPGGNFPTQRGGGVATGFGKGQPTEGGARKMADSGGASRFFYVAKASKTDRSEGLGDLPLRKSNQRSEVAAGIWADMEAPKQNFHPTVKPTTLMEYLVKLVTPPGGTVLDPFTGSGSTGKAAILNGFGFIGIEMTEDYVPIIEGRLKHAEKTAAEAKEQETLEETEKLF
jgi:site-specific DNA-methyltransferase (adenine-specific)